MASDVLIITINISTLVKLALLAKTKVSPLQAIKAHGDVGVHVFAATSLGRGRVVNLRSTVLTPESPGTHFKGG